MGRDKATLPFGPESMLQRVVRLLQHAVPTEHIVVVAAPGQVLPTLPNDVRVVRDEREGAGPLEGLAVGLSVLGDPEQGNVVDAAYATACDVPLLAPAFVAWMFHLLGDHDIAVPKEDRFHHPLAAVYRPSVAPIAKELLAAERMRPLFLFERCRTLEVPIEDLRRFDPDLATLRNCNHPEDYAAALIAAGFPPPETAGS